MEREESEMTFEKEIIHLISLQQEGGYWDFKKQWYEKKCDLLHDIICMANNLYDRTAYIIIGVDEEHEYAILDVKNDQNRRNTQKIVDFLKDKKFAGGIRPLVHVEQIRLHGADIDIIVIENSYNTPFYLIDQFEGVRANHIYTRVMDTNTPIDKSADINNVEYLWRKRFHLNDIPIGKFHYFLKSIANWETIQNQDEGYFYQYAPEYTIVYEEDEHATAPEYYIFDQIDTHPSWWLITLKYHQTAIKQFQGIALDGGRCFVVAPDRAYDLMRVDICPVGFYIQNSLKMQLLNFFLEKMNPEMYDYTTYMAVILVFKSTDEHDRFLTYVKDNLAYYNELYNQQGDSGLPYFPEHKPYNMDAYKKEYRDALVLQKMLAKFREQSSRITTEEKVNADT